MRLNDRLTHLSALHSGTFDTPFRKLHYEMSSHRVAGGGLVVGGGFGLCCGRPNALAISHAHVSPSRLLYSVFIVYYSSTKLGLLEKKERAEACVPSYRLVQFSLYSFTLLCRPSRARQLIDYLVIMITQLHLRLALAARVTPLCSMRV